MSKVIFKASKFLSDDEMNAEMYLTDKDTRSWVDYCDGKEVEMENDMFGKIPKSGYFYLLDTSQRSFHHLIRTY